MKPAPLLAMILLKANIPRQRPFIVQKALPGRNFQVIHLAVRKFYVTAVPVILQTRHIGNAMYTGKESCFLKNITHPIRRDIPFFSKSGSPTDISLKTGCIFKPSVINRHTLGEVDNSIRRNTIIPKVLFRIPCPGIPGIFFDPKHQ